MRKNTRIQYVEIKGRNVQAFDQNGASVKLSRQQRDMFTKYKSPDFIDNILREFSADILSEDFYIKKFYDDDEKIVFSR